VRRSCTQMTAALRSMPAQGVQEDSARPRSFTESLHCLPFSTSLTKWCFEMIPPLYSGIFGLAFLSEFSPCVTRGLLYLYRAVIQQFSLEIIPPIMHCDFASHSPISQQHLTASPHNLKHNVGFGPRGYQRY
jgi:hypothetical protein